MWHITSFLKWQNQAWANGKHLTKTLHQIQFTKLQDKLGLVDFSKFENLKIRIPSEEP